MQFWSLWSSANLKGPLTHQSLCIKPQELIFAPFFTAFTSRDKKKSHLKGTTILVLLYFSFFPSEKKEKAVLVVSLTLISVLPGFSPWTMFPSRSVATPELEIRRPCPITSSVTSSSVDREGKYSVRPESESCARNLANTRTVVCWYLRLGKISDRY